MSGTAPEDYHNPARFFARTCFTRAFRDHVGFVLRQLSGRTDNTAPPIRRRQDARADGALPPGEAQRGGGQQQLLCAKPAFSAYHRPRSLSSSATPSLGARHHGLTCAPACWGCRHDGASLDHAESHSARQARRSCRSSTRCSASSIATATWPRRYTKPDRCGDWDDARRGRDQPAA